ncbi:MAG: hypothetical protein BGO26_06795 [Actinobacteria bacterium 69-20]|nr:hypothetical protein [Actinomycetota bacterium]OJV28142.1 MAG: hypothetical protein BGO26_06795 [Actinobacteria bacterium 69-20]
MADDVQQQTDAWVTSTSPLMVVTKCATTACPADKLASTTPAVGDRVQVTLRNPRPPLVQGVVA